VATVGLAGRTDVGAVITAVWKREAMVRDPFADEDQPDLQDVLDALDDPDCRAIVSALDEPMTASEISDASDIPLSTTYRKIERLTDASLLQEGTEIRPDGQHASIYEVNFEEVVIALTEHREFEAEIAHAPRTPDQRLEDLWSEVRKET
jgi:DNA-binding transcriptional ArsR family regulator